MSMSTLHSWLYAHTDARALAIFRIIFGVLMFQEILGYIDMGLVEQGLLAPKLLFPYDGFEWVKPMGLPAMKGLLVAMAVAALLIVVGLFHRWAAGFFAVGFLYIVLMERSYWNNHLYLFVLLAFLVAITPASRTWSLQRALFGKQEPRTAPRWAWLILRVQVVIVYFYGGLAKMTPDWFGRGEPVRSMLKAFAEKGHSEVFWTSEPVVLVFLAGGLLFDLAVGPLLWWKRTRLYTIPFVVLFNTTNHFVFDDIGVFPLFMLLATVLFFDPEEIAALLDRVFGKARSAKPAKKGRDQEQQEALATTPKPLVTALLGGYLAFQLLFPLRWTVWPGYPDWTSITQRFSWRMKATSRSPQIVAFFVEDVRSGQVHPVQVTNYINTHQQRVLAYDPRMCVRFAHWMKGEAARLGMEEVRVTSRIIISYNGRPYRYLWPVDQDLSAVQMDLRRPDAWVPPLEAPHLELDAEDLANMRRWKATHGASLGQ